MLASDRPFPERDAAALAERLPPAAARDLVEWGPPPDPESMFEAVLQTEIPANQIVSSPGFPPLRDDRPVNEYFLLRQLGSPR
jgi:hypothetical protein